MWNIEGISIAIMNINFVVGDQEAVIGGSKKGIVEHKNYILVFRFIRVSFFRRAYLALILFSLKIKIDIIQIIIIFVEWKNIFLHVKIWVAV